MQQPVSWWKVTRSLLLLLTVALVAAGVTLVVSISRTPGTRTEDTAAVDNTGCLVCHGDPEYEPKSAISRPWHELYTDETILASSTHGPVECVRCHETFDTGRRIKGPAVQALCSSCHAEELALQEASVHGDPKVATCLDCHSPNGSGHDIPAVLDTDSPIFAKNVAETCGGCHADEQLMARYDLDTDIHEVYLASPHGKVVKLTGSDLDGLQPATCTTCHGSHEVLAVDDPASPVKTRESLAAVCGTCHEGANVEFAATLSAHEDFSSEELSPPAFYGERFFFVLTAGVVGLGILIVSLEGLGWLTGRAGDGHGGPPTGGGGPDDSSAVPGNPGPGHNPGHNPGSALSALATAPPEAARADQATLIAPPSRFALPPDKSPLPQEITRFDAHQRLQHILMMGSFLVLAFTGLPQKFPDLEISQALIGAWGGLDAVRSIHRFAGLIMIVDCVYHLAYVGYGTLVLNRPVPVWMIPTPRDIADFFQDLQFWFGRSSERPRFSRFSYREKFDYWAIFWGMPVMAISGLILMFPVLLAKVLPGEFVPVAMVAHSDEAILAVLWIFIVHFFFVHLNPRFFPLNRSIFTGKMPRRLYAEEHPLELSALDGQGSARD